jgi:hypothetical protein
MEEPAGSVRGPHYPLGELDAAKWAAEFVRLFGGDEGLMLGWFANAIMTGYDEAMRRQSPAAREAGGDVAARAHPEGKAKDDASEAAMAAPEVPCANGHVWTHQFGDDWTPETGTSCDCGKKKWGIPLAVAQEPGPPVTVEPKP